MASLQNPVQATETVAARLQAATVAHRDAQEVARKAGKTWRQLVVEAIDAGMRQGDVAQLAGVARARIHAILVSEHRAG